MKLSKFKYKLPPELIALHPTPNRDEARLMVLDRKTGKIEHKVFKDVIDYFDEKDVFVFNDSKVFPARLYGNKEKTGAEIEVFLLRELNPELRIWDVLVDPARKIRIGNKLYFGEDDSMVAEVIDNTTSRGRTLRFLFDGEYDEFKKELYALGETPLPRFINRKVEPEDAENYQTIFARHEGAVAAPTAGMHFSRELMKRMDSEQIFVTPETVKIVNDAKDEKHKICAVGTTVVRTLESCVTTKGRLTEFEGWTNKFIFPPYDFSVPDAFISNFHLPYSTLLMMVAAFGGYEHVMEAYNQAVKEKYRFGTYGDAMLII